MQIAGQIMPCLWFDTQAEEAAKFYVSIFKNSKLGKISRYGKAGQDIHGKKEGSVMTVEFELGGRPFVALNGGPQFKLSEAVSFQIFCDTQAEIDHFWNALSKGGQEGPCGWLKDKYGLSWQIVPSILGDLLQSKDAEKSNRAMKAMMQMDKIDIEGLKRAYDHG